MAGQRIQLGDHRYMDGQPITVINPSMSGTYAPGFQYVHGHVDICNAFLTDLAPEKP